MPILSRNLLKSFFERGDKPTQGQFAALIDSFLHTMEDQNKLGLRAYESNRIYTTGEAVLYNGELYQALQNTTGVFNPDHWRIVFSSDAIQSVDGTNNTLQMLLDNNLVDSWLRQSENGIHIADGKSLYSANGNSYLQFGTPSSKFGDYAYMETNDGKNWSWLYLDSGDAFMGSDFGSINITSGVNDYIFLQNNFITLTPNLMLLQSPSISAKASAGGTFSEGAYTELIINSDRAFIRSSYLEFAGLMYENDYSWAYTDRSLVDKGYISFKIQGTANAYMKLNTIEVKTPGGLGIETYLSDGYFSEDAEGVILQENKYIRGVPVGTTGSIRSKLDFGNASYGYIYLTPNDKTYLYIDPHTGEADLQGNNGGIFITEGLPLVRQYLQFGTSAVLMKTPEMIFGGDKVRFTSGEVYLDGRLAEYSSDFFGILSDSFNPKLTAIRSSRTLEISFGQADLMNLKAADGGVSTEIALNAYGITISSANDSFAGLQYAFDHSFFYTERSLIDRGYLDGQLNIVNDAITDLETRADQVTTGSQTTTTAFGTIYTYTPEAQKTFYVTGYIAGRKDDGTKHAAFRIHALAYKTSEGTVVIVESRIEEQMKSDTDYAVQFRADVGNLLIEGHGNTTTAETVSWTIHAKITKV